MSLSSQKLNRRTVLGATTLGAAAAMMPVVGGIRSRGENSRKSSR